jgi:RNA polymerase sigma-70 factor (ECF subfamily)
MDDPDRKLADRARRGDREALASLYESYRGRLFGFLVRSLGDRAMAEDVFQETWTKVLGSVSRFDPRKGSFRSWLFRISSNAASDRMRRESVRRGDELDAFADDGAGDRRIDHVASNDPDPERLSFSGEAGRALNRALASLPVKQRAAILLRHQQGLGYVEIARVLDIPEGTVKTNVHRGVSALRRTLREWSDA